MAPGRLRRPLAPGRKPAQGVAALRRPARLRRPLAPGRKPARGVAAPRRPARLRRSLSPKPGHGVAALRRPARLRRSLAPGGRRRRLRRPGPAQTLRHRLRAAVALARRPRPLMTRSIRDGSGDLPLWDPLKREIPGVCWRRAALSTPSTALSLPILTGGGRTVCSPRSLALSGPSPLAHWPLAKPIAWQCGVRSIWWRTSRTLARRPCQ